MSLGQRSDPDLVSKHPSPGPIRPKPTHLNSSKTWLLMKERFMDKADNLFHNTGVSITCEGQPFLGSPLSTAEFASSWAEKKVEHWVCELSTLSYVLRVHTQEVYSALTHGLMRHWTYLSKTCPDVSPFFRPLEDMLHSKLLPSLTSLDPLNDILCRDLLVLPSSPESWSSSQYLNSLSLCVGLLLT